MTTGSSLQNDFTRQAGIQYPIICGAMYPCSNPELVAAVSDSGAIGIIQPLTFVYVYGYDFREGIKRIKSLTDKPFGMNVLIERQSAKYDRSMRAWVDIALDEGCRFFITALGKPDWVVQKAHSAGGIVYHDVTERKWGLKAKEHGVDGLICVNNRAGGHAGAKSPEELVLELKDLGLPLIRAGGIGCETDFTTALAQGYQGVQMGTRFIATEECAAHMDYKKAVVTARASDIVLTERVTGIPLSVISTPHVKREGTTIGPIARYLFKHPRTKTWIRTWYNLRAVSAMKRSNLKGLSTKDYYQAGKSVEGVEKIEKAGYVVRRFVRAAEKT